MSGRFPGSSKRFTGREWTLPLGRDLDEVLLKLFQGASIAQKEPSDPSTIQAGASANPGTTTTAVPPALEDHVHAIETAAALALSAVGDDSAEGTGTALARADHVHDSTSLLVMDWML